MKIGRIEMRQLPKARRIVDRQAPATEGDQALGPQFLERPVDVDAGLAQRMGKVVLGQRQRASRPRGEANRREAGA